MCGVREGCARVVHGECLGRPGPRLGVGQVGSSPERPQRLCRRHGGAEDAADGRQRCLPALHFDRAEVSLAQSLDGDGPTLETGRQVGGFAARHGGAGTDSIMSICVSEVESSLPIASPPLTPTWLWARLPGPARAGDGCGADSGHILPTTPHLSRINVVCWRILDTRRTAPSQSMRFQERLPRYGA